MKSRGTGFTDVGMRRAINEDAFLIDHDLGLFVVSDGMGGHAAGEVAAREAVAGVHEYIRGQQALLQRIRSGLLSQTLLSSIARIAIAFANRKVYEIAARNPSLRGMGCTMTLLLVGREHAAMAHVGDSRMYLSRDGILQQLSVDHTVAEEFARRGLISRAQVSMIPQGQALCRAVGVRETIEVDELLFDIEEGDRFILCSDGVWGYLSRTRDLERFMYSLELDEIAEGLVRYANASGGHDNSTALVIELGDSVQPSVMEMDTLESLPVQLTTPSGGFQPVQV